MYFKINIFYNFIFITLASSITQSDACFSDKTVGKHN